MKQKKEAQASVLFIKGVPKELKNSFRAHCAMRGQSMTNTVLDFMRQTVQEKSISKA